MKRPIEPADIRAGDLIRCEWPDDSASEWRSKTSGPAGWNADRVSYFLLDRPSPPVELPTEPTLGWLTTDAEPMLDEWCAMTQLDPGYDDYGDWATGNKTGHRREAVTAFKRATAVPTTSVVELRNIFDSADRHPVSAESFRRVVRNFLAAVDEANA